MTVLVVGALLGPGPRTALWAAAIVLDLLAGIAVRGVSWRVHVSHFAERHGLFVIIALGESLIAIGLASSALEATVESFAVKGAGVAVVCGLWWVYFGWFKSWLEERVEASRSIDMVRNSYSFVHFLVVMGVVGVAAGLEEAVAHPEGPFTDPAALALVTGTVAYVGGIAALAWMTGRIFLGARLLGLGSIVALAVIAPVTGVNATVVVAFVAAILALVGLSEHRRAVTVGAT